MASSLIAAPRFSPGAWLVSVALRPIHLLITQLVPLYLLALTAMLFRPPDLSFYGIDRIAFLLLIVATILCIFVTHAGAHFSGHVTWPLLALFFMGLVGLLLAPYRAEEWSTFAAKWAVPFAMFHISQLVFTDTRSLRRLETFLLFVLGYLALTAVFTLADARLLIFPRYILDESLGIHFDRARGPFLQAVANGVTIVLLGLVASDSFRRRRLRGWLALAFAVAIPLAVLATRTRAVWIAFAAVVLTLCFFRGPICKASLAVVAACALTLGSLSLMGSNSSLSDRLEERSPVEFRFLLYQTGWDMLREKPLLGWPAGEIQPELQQRMDGQHPQSLAFHNNYLEVAVGHGLIGLALYFWMFLDLFRLARRPLYIPRSAPHFLDPGFRRLWPAFVAVYALNACFVVMNYQFVNALLFTIAGILAAQTRAAREMETQC